ncbi:hypothetical protein GF366_01850 [Candidatus Peregrinibacteria bacterium]|nr:hypothetical protein [Candidatus Peregrinibacteria bacterium]
MADDKEKPEKKKPVEQKERGEGKAEKMKREAQKEKTEKRGHLRKDISQKRAKDEREDLKEKVKKFKDRDFPSAKDEKGHSKKEKSSSEKGSDPFKDVKIFDEEPEKKSDKSGEKSVEPINPFESPLKTHTEKEEKDKKGEEVEKKQKKEEKSKEREGKREEESVKKAEETDAVPGKVVEVKKEDEKEEKTEVPEVVEVKGKPVGGHVEPAETSVSPEGAETDESKEDFWDVLEQAGITKKRIVYFFFILVGLILALYFIFSFIGEEEPVYEVSEEEEAVESEGDSDSYEIVSSYILGLEYTKDGFTPIDAVPIGEIGEFVGVDTAYIIGGVTGYYESRIIYYNDILRRMENIYNTDIYALLDMSVDRRKALNVHLSEMLKLIEKGESAYEEIDQAMEAFDSEYEQVVEERDLYEEDFFSYSQEFYGKNAYDSLESFIIFSQKAARIKAYYNAYDILKGMFTSSINALRPRYEDILSNKEAVIKGIRVFDIPASDIEAIIPVEGD